MVLSREVCRRCLGNRIELMRDEINRMPWVDGDHGDNWENYCLYTNITDHEEALRRCYDGDFLLGTCPAPDVADDPFEEQCDKVLEHLMATQVV